MLDLLTDVEPPVTLLAHKGEEVFHPDSFFADPAYAAFELPRLALQFDHWLRGRAKPPKAPTLTKYQNSLKSLFRSMAADGTPLELRYLHPAPVESWIAACRATNHAEAGIASALAAVKVFANSYVFKHAELCNHDPLRKVARLTPPEKDMPVLDEAELDQILACFADDYEGVRNKAFVAILMGTGCRLRECRQLTMDRWNPVAGELTLLGKGDRLRYACLSTNVHMLLKAYLRLRPKRTSGDLWLCRDGSSMSEWAWVSVLRRLKQRSRIPRVRAHLFRHTFGSLAIQKGAERAAVQDMLGHESDYMTKRYTRAARKRTASAMMPQYSPV